MQFNLKTKKGNFVNGKIEPELRFHIFVEMKPEKVELYQIIHENGISAISADTKSANEFFREYFEDGEFWNRYLEYAIQQIQESDLDLWTRKFLLNILEKGMTK